MKEHETSAARWRWPILCTLLLLRGLPATGGANPPFLVGSEIAIATNSAYERGESHENG